MPRPRYRSGSLRKIYVRIPSGRATIHYERKTRKNHRCALCGKPLQGVPKDPSKKAKSSRRPERPYGGYLCASCLNRELTKEIIRRYAPNILNR